MNEFLFHALSKLKSQFESKKCPKVAATLSSGYGGSREVRYEDKNDKRYNKRL
jgi:hypothetical protein